MSKNPLREIALKMVEPHKGILAADESINTAGKRFDLIGIPNTEENRMRYRDLFFSTPDIERYISGVILHDETIKQKNASGTPFVKILEHKGIMPGIKVDAGAEDLPGFPREKITYGLDGLNERLREYKELGAQFAKWRAVITIGDTIPTQACIDANVHALARYARLVQDAGMVPMVEPEVLLEGEHGIERAEEVTTKTLFALFSELIKYRVDLHGVILKTSMVLPGADCPKANPKLVADATVRTLKASVPREVPGVVFLSGGQEPKEATTNLNAIAQCEPLPWQIAFSYARALQEPALIAWKGDDTHKTEAQDIFLKRLTLNIAADNGSYTGMMEAAS